ncbi:Clp domain-containing protein [Caballeronia choica]|uniref:Clp domain-containing protein n=1 Tax=Caballeronia choica TaxID=326476 RepID=A0A158IT25_9BURK|nr:hypothetical protein [Caballeronia choica]SAL59718.1 Clp domain-containing protein [Caballeronia choica]
MATCSVCGKPATSQITITENGQRRQLTLCDEHYMQFMARNQRSLSPLESLFHGGLFESLFDDMLSPLEGRRGGWQPLGQADETHASGGKARAAAASRGANASGGPPAGRVGIAERARPSTCRRS